MKILKKTAGVLALMAVASFCALVSVKPPMVWLHKRYNGQQE